MKFSRKIISLLLCAAFLAALAGCAGAANGNNDGVILYTGEEDYDTDYEKYIYKMDDCELIYAKSNTESKSKVDIGSTLKLTRYADGNYEYKVSIVGVVGTPEHIDIPEFIEGYPVTYVTLSCDSLVSLTVPDGVMVLNVSGSNCPNLKSITIPADITMTSYEINRYTKNGIEVIDNRSETSFDVWMVTDSPDTLESVTIPEETTEIRFGAFWLAANYDNNICPIQEIYLPDSVTKIDALAFANCSKLEKIRMSPNLTYIGYSAFSGCNMSEIYIPSGVTVLGSETFEACQSLRTVELCDGLEEIHRCVFAYCTSLEEIVIPATVRIIWYHAFENCTSLRSVTFMGDIPELGEDVFLNCPDDLTFYNAQGEVIEI